MTRPGQTWIDLLPGGLLRVGLDFFQDYAQQLGAGTSAPRGLTGQELVFDMMGQILREGRVRRLDLYTCSIGGTEAGRRILDAIHHFWRIPLWGLRGPLEIVADPLGRIDRPFARVLAPEGITARQGAYGRPFIDRLINDTSLWAASHNRPPPPR